MEYVKNPFIAITPPFIAGILFSVFFEVNSEFIFPALLIILFIFLFFEKKFFSQKPHNFGISIYIFMFLFGFYLTNHKKPDEPIIDSTKKIVYEGVIVEPPKEKRKTIHCVVKIEAFLDSVEWKKADTKAVVYFQKDSISEAFKYGDRILLNSYLNPIKNPGNPKEFDYKSFMQQKGIFTTAYAKNGDFTFLEAKQANFFIDFATNLRSNLLKIYQYFGIQDQEYAVLSALTLGYRDEVDIETRDKFANTGAMHILAVSGLHVGIIFMILNVLLNFMDKNRKLKIIKSVIIIFSLWIFAGIAGLSPSVNRSALMFSLVVIGKMINKNSSTFNTIFASAFVLLIINPLDILSVGFQLSYSAVLAIVYFQPFIYKLLFFKRWLPDQIWALTSVSIAAQIGTMPFGFFYFHQFPNYFFISNILVIPLSSIILYLAVALMILSFIPVINGFIAFLLKLSMKILIGGVTLIDKIPYSTSKNISVTPAQTITLYIVILSFVMFWMYNKRQLLYTFLVSLIIFLSLNIIKKYNIQKSSEILVYNTQKYPVLNILTGKNNYVLTDTITIKDEKAFNYISKPYWVEKKSLKPLFFNLDSLKNTKYDNKVFAFNNNFFKIGNTSFLILNQSKQLEFTIDRKKNVDYIILSQNIYTDIKPIVDLFDFKTIIFDGTNKNWRTEKWKEQCENLNIPYYDITTQGAFAVDFKTKEILKL